MALLNELYIIHFSAFRLVPGMLLAVLVLFCPESSLNAQDTQLNQGYIALHEPDNKDHINILYRAGEAVEKEAFFLLSRQKRQARALRQSIRDTERIFASWQRLGRMRIDSLGHNAENKHVLLYMSPELTHLPVRDSLIIFLNQQIKGLWPRSLNDHSLMIFSRGYPLQDYIPNALRRSDQPRDQSRIRNIQAEGAGPFLQRSDRDTYPAGLQNRHLALWHSHGLYYNMQLGRWQWQRARLYGTVEDIFPAAYVIPYLVPMLENAGAYVWLPRERDTQLHEVIVKPLPTREWSLHPGGFLQPDSLFEGQNPFALGQHLQTQASPERDKPLQLIAEMPESGSYAVYVSWSNTGENVPDVSMRLYHAGGSTDFVINQQMAYGTWVYLGHFDFLKGGDAEKGSLEVFGHSDYQGRISFDALRLGGGMGNVARRPSAEFLANQPSVLDRQQTPASQTGTGADNPFPYSLSGMPRYVEGARYYLQYAGFPDSLVYSLNQGKNDYNDDYMSRGEWVNYLLGNPLGPLAERSHRGLGIPVALSLAFHTDAGITPNDSVIGTLAIYSAQRDEMRFPDGVSRLASRDLSDMVQSQIVNDIRALHDPAWTRRALWDRAYAEARRPNVPALLLELLSHQNLADMALGLDPRFQFNVSRAIYKGMLRYMADAGGYEAVVSPLAPEALALEPGTEDTLTISWQPQDDPLEPGAGADYFTVWQREGQWGFAPLIQTRDTQISIELPEINKHYSFRVTAHNRGGMSFPSETLSAGIHSGDTCRVLVINAFDRISGPGIIDVPGLAGLAWWEDPGMPDHFQIGYTGPQYDFNRQSAWLDDDSPGWGASHSEYEGQLVAGNRFDYTLVHGQAIMEAGCSYVSVSRRALEQGRGMKHDYWALSLIGGAQKTQYDLRLSDKKQFSLFTPELIRALDHFASQGSHMLLSGSYLGSDLMHDNDTLARAWACQTAGYSWRSDFASTGGLAGKTALAGHNFPEVLTFNQQWHSQYYRVHAPDALEPCQAEAFTLYRYQDGWRSAIVANQAAVRSISMGFPFESITDSGQRSELMQAVFGFFNQTIVSE